MPLKSYFRGMIKKMNSGLMAKLLVRVFFLLIVLALVAAIKYEDKLKGLGSIRLDQWRLVFPLLLIIGFIVLLVLAALKKYRQTDLNWLLIVNTVMLMINGLAIFMRI